jgi:hypothetical protein
VNTDELEHATIGAERRVLEIQTKLHRWARDDPHRRFDDLFNLVAVRREALVRREAPLTEGGANPPRWVVAAAW